MSYLNPSKRKNLRSQIAVIITLIIAAILLMTMVFINIHKVSSIKTLTSQTSDKTALRIASKIGSISKAYWSALGDQEEACGWQWNIDLWGLFKLAVVAVVTMVAFLFVPNPVILLTGIGLFVSMAMGNAIMQKFQDMTAYNAIREEALFQGMQGLQSDYVELKNLGGANQGKFQDPSDPGSTIYNLTEIPTMIKELKVSRFLAWYYTQRFPLVDESVLKAAVGEFINGKIINKTDGLKEFVNIDEWDTYGWKINKISWILEGQRGMYSAGPFTVTCGLSCPGWVLNSARDRIKLISIKEDGSLDDNASWFIKDKLQGCDYLPLLGPRSCWGILKRLECDYGSIFCNNPGCIVKQIEFDSVEGDMRLILAKIKEVLDLPIAERLRGLTQWFPFFYDPSAHNPDRSSKYNTGNFNEDNKYDIYLRLNRDKAYIQQWIDGLTNLNTNTIIPPIPPDYGSYCLEGRGNPNPAGYCYTGIDPCLCNHIKFDDCGTPYVYCDPNPEGCINLAEAEKYGIYGTCAGDDPYNSHPVCQNGDLYSTVPVWCSEYNRNEQCVSLSDDCEGKECSIPTESLAPVIKEYYYQGQMSWRPAYTYGIYDWTGGPTEVDQTIRVLQAWYDVLVTMQGIIEKLQVEIEKLQTPEIQALRNEIIYAWKDKASTTTDIPQYSHIVRLKIRNYPERLPYISESVSFAINWLGSWNCRKLHDYKGLFDVEVSRYDQDQPNMLWNLRRRQQPLNPQYDTGILSFIVDDIQDTGKVALPREISLQAILDNYAITSRTQTQYGPKKEDIAITSIGNTVVN